MSSAIWDDTVSQEFRREAARRSRRKTVTQILRAAYRKHVRDRETKAALRRCLR